MQAGQRVCNVLTGPSRRLDLLVTNLQPPRVGTSQAGLFQSSCAHRSLLTKQSRDQRGQMAGPARAQARSIVCATDSSDYVPTDEVEV